MTNKQAVTVLLIEDDDVDAMSITRAFNKMSLDNEIIRATDGLEGIEMLRSGTVPSPYIILLDLQMPRLNGLEFLAEIRSDPKLDKSIIFVLTTSKTDHDITASYKKNIAGYFVKEKVADGFLEIVNVLKSYGKIVRFPEQ